MESQIGLYKDRVDHATQALARLGRRGGGHPRVGRLVQPAAHPQRHRRYSTRRIISRLLRSTPARISGWSQPVEHSTEPGPLQLLCCLVSGLPGVQEAGGQGEGCAQSEVGAAEAHGELIHPLAVALQYFRASLTGRSGQVRRWLGEVADRLSDGLTGVIGTQSDFGAGLGEDGTDRFDSERVPVLVDIGGDQRGAVQFRREETRRALKDRIRLAQLTVPRSSRAIRSVSPLVVPGCCPASTSARLTQIRNTSGWIPS